MLLSIIICTYKRPLLLKNCLIGAMEVLENINSEIIIINDCKEDSISVPLHKNITLINNPKKGLASARNFGSQNAKGDVLLFVDDDIEFTLTNVLGLLELYNANPGTCYNSNWKYSDEMYASVKRTQFGRFIIKYKLINYKGWVGDINWQETVFEVHKLAGFFMLMPKAALDLVEGFNEGFICQGTEDDELCMRLVKANIKMYVDPNNYVFHNEVDRISLEDRMYRYYNGAINRRRACDMGHKEYEIIFPIHKKLVYRSLSPFRKSILLLPKLIPNKKFLDFIYFKMAHLLLGIFIFSGYNDPIKKT